MLQASVLQRVSNPRTRPCILVAGQRKSSHKMGELRETNEKSCTKEDLRTSHAGCRLSVGSCSSKRRNSVTRRSQARESFSCFGKEQLEWDFVWRTVMWVFAVPISVASALRDANSLALHLLLLTCVFYPHLSCPSPICFSPAHIPLLLLPVSQTHSFPTLNTSSCPLPHWP